MITFIFFIIGLFLGSFFLVIIDRFEGATPFWRGRSQCDHCKKTLGILDLIPVVSYLVTQGYCRQCHVKISVSYPLFELLTGTVFAISYVIAGGSGIVALLFSLFITSCLLLIFFIDFRYGIIPFSIIFPAILATFIYFIIPYSLFVMHIYAALGAFLFFLVIFLGTKGRGMGFGDVVYAFFMGLLLGFPNIIVGLYIAFLTGAVVSLILILLKKKKLKGSTIPFGPFLVLGTYISIVFGEWLVRFFIRFLNLA